MTEVNAFQPVDSLQMMAYIIDRCQALKVYLNTTKLQKLMYCCYGAVLGKFGKRLMDEHPVARQYGPVFPEALRSVQFFKIDGFRGRGSAVASELPKSILDLVDETLVVFGKNTAAALSNWTHLKGSPWYNASRGGTVLYSRLSDADVARYFREKVLQ